MTLLHQVTNNQAGIGIVTSGLNGVATDQNHSVQYPAVRTHQVSISYCKQSYI